MVLALGANAQGRNTGMGGSDGDYQSLSERVFKLEKKTDAFNVFQLCCCLPGAVYRR